MRRMCVIVNLASVNEADLPDVYTGYYDLFAIRLGTYEVASQPSFVLVDKTTNEAELESVLSHVIKETVKVEVVLLDSDLRFSKAFHAPVPMTRVQLRFIESYLLRKLGETPCKNCLKFMDSAEPAFLR